MANADPYFQLPGVSNSDLSKLQSWLHPVENPIDPTEAYKFGTLIDAIITEPQYVDYYKRICHGEKYKQSDFDKAKKMKESFMNDDFCRKIIKQSSFQKVDQVEKEFHYEGMTFTLPCKCKWDLWLDSLGWGGDIKSTTATTQKQFEAACYYFHYPRQRAWYMNIAGSKQDVLIGISKVNFKIFKIYINQGDEFHTTGVNEMNLLAYRYKILLQNLTA